MTTFSTPEPIDVTLELAAGEARITATDRDDTVVEVRPRDPARSADVRAADQVRVEFGDGRLLVKTQRQGLGLSRVGAVDVTIAVPARSRLDGHTGVGDLHAEGRLGACTYKSGAGAIRLGQTGVLKVVAGAGDISVESADGAVVAVTGSGAIHLGAVAGDAIVKNGNGAATVGDVAGDVRVATSNGDVTVGRSGGSVVAKTANGNLRVGAVQGGDVELRTAYGSIEVGIAEGSAARLDVRTAYGRLRQELDPAGTPPPGAPTVSVKARTSHGDITIRRAPAAPAARSAAAYT